jgi:sugar lactone lactonase YvrE
MRTVERKGEGFMQQRIRLCAVIAGALFSFAGCGGGTGATGTSPITSGFLPPQMRTPAEAIIPDGWPKHVKSLLFVSELKHPRIKMYNPTTVNPSPIGSLDTGLKRPVGLAVDGLGNLFVVDNKTNTVVAYHHGGSKPYFTITTGMNSPYGIAIDDAGEVFVSNTGGNAFSIVGYKPGSQTPFETIDFTNFGQPVGLNVDSHSNLWVAAVNGPVAGGAVYEILAGTSNVQNADLNGIGSPIGIALGQKDVMYVTGLTVSSPPQSYVNIYPYGSKDPSGQITSGIEYPQLNTVTKSGVFFQTGLNRVTGYQPGQYTPFSTISVKEPIGIAAWPRIH